MKPLLSASLLLAFLASSTLAQAPKGMLQPTDTVSTILSANQGKAVELHLKSGGKLAGKVESLNNNLVHLTGLTVQELFEAFVNEADVVAVVVRMK